MAKKRKAEGQCREHSELRPHPIDSIPKYTKQRRSPAPKRRAHFSIFLISSPSSASFGSSISGSNRPGLSSKTTISLDNNKGGEALPDPPLIQFIRSMDKISRPLSDFYEVPVATVESIRQVAAIDSFVDRKKIDTNVILKPTPKKSRVVESNHIFVPATMTTQAETACWMQQPAEMIGETSSLADSSSQGIDGHAFLQLSEDHCSAWDDQARDLSNFPDALEMKEDPSSRGPLHGSPDGSSHSYQLDHSPTDRWRSSTSSRTEGIHLKRGDDKRERKVGIGLRLRSYVSIKTFPGGSPIQDNAASRPCGSHWFPVLTRPEILIFNFFFHLRYHRYFV